MKEAERKSEWVQYTQIGFQMLGTIGLGVWLGIKADEWLDLSFPYFTIGLSVVFIFASVYNVIRQLPKF